MRSDDLKLMVHTSKQPEEIPETARKRKRPQLHIKTRLSFHERLLRNSMLACALLLGILSLGNLDAPWAKKAAGGIERALTMEINLDQSLGQLSFVRKIMPESALVFLNLSGKDATPVPVDGTLTHAYLADQPWLMYAVQEDAPVYACADGTVSAISPLSDGSYGVLIDHGDGLESVTACLKTVSIAQGGKVQRGTLIGASGSSLYFELRQGGNACDPMEKFGL